MKKLYNIDLLLYMCIMVFFMYKGIYRVHTTNQCLDSSNNSVSITMTADYELKSKNYHFGLNSIGDKKLL